MSLSDQAESGLRAVVDATVNGESAIPGATVVVVDRNGDDIFAYSSGKRGISSAEPMTLDNVFWIASCTKMVTALACMQLVEKGDLRLDDAEQIEGLCPELKTKKVLKRRADGGLELEEKKKGITLRMLLTHTAGFTYSFFNREVRDWSMPVGIEELDCDAKEMMSSPLVFQPGERWEYGVGRPLSFSLCTLSITSHVLRMLGLDLLHTDDYGAKNYRSVSTGPASS
jgi:CubicO group peptidase (beta-lactamase class C family)